MSEPKYVGVNHVQTKINGNDALLVDTFFKPREIITIESIDRPGVYGGNNIFDPTQYTANGISTPSDGTTKLETYYKNFIGTSIDAHNKPTILKSYERDDRPDGVLGLTIFDTTLNKVITYNGANWVDQAGRIS